MQVGQVTAGMLFTSNVHQYGASMSATSQIPSMVRSHRIGPRSSNQKPASPDTPPYWSRSPNPIGVSLRMNGRGPMRDASSVHRVLNGNVE